MGNPDNPVELTFKSALSALEEGNPVMSCPCDTLKLAQYLQRIQCRDFSLTFENAAIGLAHLDLQGNWLEVNQSLCDIVGYPREELLRLSFQDITHPDDLDEDLAQLSRLVAGAIPSYRLEKRYLRKDGSLIWIRLNATLMRDEAEHPAYFISVIEDITRTKELEFALQASANRFRTAFDNIPDVVVIYDRELRIQYINPATYRTTGLPPEAFLGRREDEVFPAQLVEPWQPLLRAALDRGDVQTIELNLVLAPGIRNLLITCVPLRNVDGQVTEVMGITHDFTERKQAEDEAIRAALHDKLTSLPNRALLFDYSGHVFDQAKRRGHPGGVLFVDLDRFKPINDLHGHQKGDRMLIEVARRIEETVRRSDMVFRIGGDEFVVLLPHIDDPTEAAHIAQRINMALAAPATIDGVELQLSASIGISLFPRDGDNIQVLVNAADNAMYLAKERGKNQWQFFSADLSVRAHVQMSLQQKLRSALARKEFELVFQPIVDAGNGRLISVEALLRWPSSGIGPDQFIPAAEAVGQIVAIGDWVIDEACRAHSYWLASGLPAEPVAVNISALRLRQRDFRDKIKSCLQAHRLPATALQIEITESAILEDLDSVFDLLHALRADGIRISLDDFGTGYSSLSYLSRLPIDKIKIDKTFVWQVNHQPPSRAVIEAIITLGRHLALDVVAEGIETNETRDTMHFLGCSELQGYLVSQPLDMLAMYAWAEAAAQPTDAHAVR